MTLNKGLVALSSALALSSCGPDKFQVEARGDYVNISAQVAAKTAIVICPSRNFYEDMDYAGLRKLGEYFMKDIVLTHDGKVFQRVHAPASKREESMASGEYYATRAVGALGRDASQEARVNMAKIMVGCEDK